MSNDPLFVWLRQTSGGRMAETSRKDPAGVKYTRKDGYDYLLDFCQREGDRADALAAELERLTGKKS